MGSLRFSIFIIDEENIHLEKFPFCRDESTLYIVRSNTVWLFFMKGEFILKTEPKIISVVNQKGGVGKTTTAWNVGIVLAKSGYKVLLLDFDPQGNLTTCLG